MIKFDPKKIRVELYEMKSCTTALGGSIRVVDHERTTDVEEIYKRLPVPLAVVRQFKVEYKTVNYLQPVLVAATYYDDSIVSLERHANGCAGTRFSKGLNGEMKEWESRSKINFEKYVLPQTVDKDWFFDGRYMFRMKGELSAELDKAERMSKDGKFRVLEVSAIALNKLWEDSFKSNKMKPETRMCLAYVAANGQFAISPPIWKNAKAVGQAKILKGGGRTDDRDLDFDKVDAACAVNISFALKAAAELSEHFGFEAIEPLQLPQLMVRMNTVNLPKVAKEVKDTYDSGINFTHALAWLLGYASRAETMEAYASVRLLLKYLTARGLFFRDSFDSKNIFRDGKSIDSIPHRDKSEALKAIEKLDNQKYVELLRTRMGRQAARRFENLHVDEDGDDLTD